MYGRSCNLGLLDFDVGGSNPGRRRCGCLLLVYEAPQVDSREEKALAGAYILGSSDIFGKRAHRGASY